MRKSVFNSKRDELLNLLQRSKEIANELVEAEKERYKKSNKEIFELLKKHSEDNDLETEKAEAIRYEAMVNKGNMDCTLHAISFEIERMKNVIMK